MPIKEEDLERFRSIGDSEADTALAEILVILGGYEPPLRLRDVIIKLGQWDPSQHQVSELPKPIADYVSLPFDDLPPWIDPVRVERAQAAYTERHLSGARIVLGFYSLPIVYVHPEISLTLTTTAQLLLHVRRRYTDTQAFTEAVMKPASLKPGQRGQLWIRRVRLTHAAARLARRNAQTPLDLPEMQLRVLGRVEDKMPLDQVELSLVIQTFAWVVVDGLREMRWAMGRGEAADHIHAWSAIGAMMGIDEKLLPRGANEVLEAENLFVLIRNCFLRAGDPLGRDAGDHHDTRLAGRLLIAAWITFLVQVQRENVPEDLRDRLTKCPRLDEALQQLPRILIRRLCGDEAARYLRIGHAGWFDRFVCWVAMILRDPREIPVSIDPPPNDAFSGALL